MTDADSEIRSEPIARCRICGGTGEALYSGLRDRLFSAAGVWACRRCVDPACALIWLDPMPIAADIHKAYASYYTHAGDNPGAGSADSFSRRLLAAAKRGYLANRYGYAAGMAERVLGLLPWIYPGRAAELDFSVMWLSPRAGGRLLDVGAGSGWLVEHMCAQGWRAEGLDFDAHSVAAARARGLVMHAGGLPEQAFPDASFDAVTMSHSIEHVHDPVGWLAEARRILRPGGRLALATPNAHSFGHRVFGAHWFALDPPRHLHLFNAGAMSRALQAAGFSRFRIFTSIRDANGRFIAGRAIRRSGRFDMTAPQSAAEKLRGRAMQMVEAGVKLVQPDAGEDLVVLADRQ